MGLIYSVSYEDRTVYIGQTKFTLEKRIKHYKNSIKDLKKKTYIINHLRCHGIENHIFKIIDTADNREDLNGKEIEWIKFHNTLFPNGLNLTEGGDSPIFSSHSLEKMSKSRMGKAPWNKGSKGKMGKHWAQGKKLPKQSLESREKKKRFGQSNHFFGKKHDLTTKNKISEKLKGRSAWNRMKISIKQVDVCGNIVKIFNDKQDVKEDGFDIGCVNRCLKISHLKHKGFYFLRNE